MDEGNNSFRRSFDYSDNRGGRTRYNQYDNSNTGHGSYQQHPRQFYNRSKVPDRRGQTINDTYKSDTRPVSHQGPRQDSHDQQKDKTQQFSGSNYNDQRPHSFGYYGRRDNGNNYRQTRAYSGHKFRADTRNYHKDATKYGEKLNRPQENREQKVTDVSSDTTNDVNTTRPVPFCDEDLEQFAQVKSGLLELYNILNIVSLLSQQ